MHSLSWDYRGALPELPSAQALIRLGAQKIFEQKLKDNYSSFIEKARKEVLVSVNRENLEGFIL